MLVQGAVQGRLCSMLVESGSAVTFLSEWFVTVELGMNSMFSLLYVRLRTSSDRQANLWCLYRRQSVWVVRDMDCDCLVGRDVLLLGSKIISDDTAVSTLGIVGPTELAVFGCCRTCPFVQLALQLLIRIAVIQNLEDQQLIHVRFDRGLFAYVCGCVCISPRFKLPMLTG